MLYNVLIGGQAGQGVETLAGQLEKILHRQGYTLFSHRDTMSRIRGGHNFVQIRFGTEPVQGHHPRLDVLAALDGAALKNHGDRLAATGVALYDSKLLDTDHAFQDDVRGLPLELAAAAEKIGTPKITGTILLGALVKLFSFPLTAAEALLAEQADNELKALALQALRSGYEQAVTRFSPDQPPSPTARLLLNGNQAMALGALAGGLDFFSGYPMSPATGLMTFFSERQVEAGIAVEQAEDEIAAINMAIGAAYAGARAMTGTSGGGFSLMTEGLGLAAIMETPLVIANVQRPGPATGLPTRTEQGDLSFVLTASQSEMPRMVIGVRSVEDAFYQTARAFNLADQYQMTVILLSDQFLADGRQTVSSFDFNSLTIEKHLAGEETCTRPYLRYRLTEDGLSPRILPGFHPGATVLVDSHEHTEAGNISESATVREAMMEKRMKRMAALEAEVLEPHYVGPEQPRLLLLGWGSMTGPLSEAVSLLGEAGIPAGALCFGDLYPLPTRRLRQYAEKAHRLFNVEQNYTGQLARLIRRETGIQCHEAILKYDGRQLSGDEIYQQAKERWHLCPM